MSKGSRRVTSCRWLWLPAAVLLTLATLAHWLLRDGADPVPSVLRKTGSDSQSAPPAPEATNPTGRRILEDGPARDRPPAANSPQSEVSVLLRGVLIAPGNQAPVADCDYAVVATTSFDDPNTTAHGPIAGSTGREGEWQVRVDPRTRVVVEFRVHENIDVRFELKEPRTDQIYALEHPALAALSVSVQGPQPAVWTWDSSVEPLRRNFGTEFYEFTAPVVVECHGPFGVIATRVAGSQMRNLPGDRSHAYWGLVGMSVVVQPWAQGFEITPDTLRVQLPSVVSFRATPICNRIDIRYVDPAGAVIPIDASVHEIDPDGTIAERQMIRGVAVIDHDGLQSIRLRFRAPDGEWFGVDAEPSEYLRSRRVDFVRGAGHAPVSVDLDQNSSLRSVWCAFADGSIVEIARAQYRFESTSLLYDVHDHRVAVSLPPDAWDRLWLALTDRHRITRVGPTREATVRARSGSTVAPRRSDRVCHVGRRTTPVLGAGGPANGDGGSPLLPR